MFLTLWYNYWQFYVNLANLRFKEYENIFEIKYKELLKNENKSTISETEEKNMMKKDLLALEHGTSSLSLNETISHKH